MSSMRVVWTVFALLGLALPAAANDAEEARKQASVEAVESARERLVVAREHVREAKATVSQAKHRRKPRGEKLEALREELDEARTELSRAEAALPERIDEARRLGAPPGLLRETEDWLRANPAANAP